MRVSEIRVNQIRVNQGLGVLLQKVLKFSRFFFFFFSQLRKKLQMQTAMILFVRSLEPNQFMSCGSQRHVLSSFFPQWSQNISKFANTYYNSAILKDFFFMN